MKSFNESLEDWILCGRSFHFKVYGNKALIVAGLSDRDFDKLSLIADAIEYC